MVTGNLILTCFSLLILVGHFLQTSHAHKINHQDCSPSACGIIRNISFPFRLKDDPVDCGYPCYELACENNVTSVYLNSQKYQVKAINYNNSTIWLADVSMTNNSCSFPKHSLYWPNFDSYSDPYTPQSRDDSISADVAWPINFMSCPYQLMNSSLFTEATDCANGDNFQLDASNSSDGRHTYIKVGHMNASDVEHMCRLDLMALTSWKFKDLKNVSLSEIHDSLLYGFELSWARFCSECGGRWRCHPFKFYFDPCDGPNLQDKLNLKWELIMVLLKTTDGPTAALILILLLILGALVIYVAVDIFSFLVWAKTRESSMMRGITSTVKFMLSYFSIN